MPALAPYVPNKDSLFDTFAANFASLIAAAPATYGLVAGDAAAISAAQALWAAAYSAAVNLTTRTPVTISAKNTERVNASRIIRPYAQSIANNAGVANPDKIALGLNPRTTTPTPITVPTTFPTIAVANALALQHVVRYRDNLAAPSTKAKPYGSIQMALYATASATAITDPTLLAFVGVATKSPFLQAWPSAAKGLTAYYAGRWMTRRGLFGPWSPIAAFTVAG